MSKLYYQILWRNLWYFGLNTPNYDLPCNYCTLWLRRSSITKLLRETINKNHTSRDFPIWFVSVLSWSTLFTVLSRAENRVLLRQLSYAIKTQFKALGVLGYFFPFAVSLWHKSADNRSFQYMEVNYPNAINNQLKTRNGPTSPT